MENSPALHWNILDKKRLALLPKITFLKEAGFYLAGGTALALQLGHRTSIDLDFYIRSKFDAENILFRFQENIKTVVLLQKQENTLITKLEGIDVSLFTYPYLLLKPLVKTEYLCLASIEDIASMKLIAIIQRGLQRDFIDFYFLIRRLGLKNIFDFTKRKYPPFNRYAALQALAYFKDAETAPAKRNILHYQPVKWPEIKKLIVSEVKKIKQNAENEE